MKKFIFILLSGILLSQFAVGQQIELIPYASYQWGGKLNFYDGEVKFNSSENYGIALNVVMPHGTGISLEYLNQPTSIDVRYWGQLGSEYKSYDVNMNWFQLGGFQQLDMGGQLAPFGGITLGAAYMSPRTNEVQDVWKFAMTGQIGLKYYISESIGIQVHLRMLMPIQWAGFGFYFGSGGSGTTVNAGSYLIQGDVGGGLIFRIGNKSASKPQPSGM